MPEIPLNQITEISAYPEDEGSENLSNSENTPRIPIHGEENSESETKLSDSQDSTTPPAELNNDAPKNQESNNPVSDTRSSTYRRARYDPSQPLPVATAGKRDIYAKLKNQRAMTARVAATAEADKKARLDLICANLPDGAEVDDKGHLSGTSCIKQVPNFSPAERDLTWHLNLIFNQQRALVMKEAKFSDSGRHIIFTPQKEKIANNALLSFAEGNIQIHTTEFFSMNYDMGPERMNKTKEALFEYVGEHNTQLSKLLTHAVPLELFNCISSRAGKKLDSLEFIGDSNGEEFTLLKNDGSVQRINNIKGAADAEFVLFSDHKGGFNVSIDWTAYCVPAGDKQEILPLGKKEVISIRLEATFNAAEWQLDTTELKFSTPDGIKTTFDGRLRLN